MRSFGEQYALNGAPLAQWGGKPVPGSVGLRFSGPCVLDVSAEFTGDLHQGVAFDVTRGTAVVGGRRSNRVVLWGGSAFPVEVSLVGGRRPLELVLWNVWRGPSGSVGQWQGNAGMRVVELVQGHLVLGCNAGPSQDLQVVARTATRVEGVRFQHHADGSGRAGHVAVPQAADRCVTAVGLGQVEQDPHRRGLAAPLGPRKPVTRPG